MTANKSASAVAEPDTTMAFRDRLSVRKRLEALALERGHVTQTGEPVLTPLLREAVRRLLADPAPQS